MRVRPERENRDRALAKAGGPVARASAIRLTDEDAGAASPAAPLEQALSSDHMTQSEAAVGVKDRAPAPRRTNDAERTRANILEIAFQEFAEKGFTGERIDEIADRTHTSKNMIYYYFGSKEILYRQVLEKCYGEIRRVESELQVQNLPALE